MTENEQTEAETSPNATPAETASAEDSEPSSTASSTGSAFIADPGPAFEASEPRAGAEPAAPAGELHALPTPPPEWEEDAVRGILTAKGQLLHVAVGVAERDWTYTEGDLAAIAPPLTRILNRYDATRAAAGTGDEIGLIIGVGGYVTRSYRERMAALRAREQEIPVPASGVPAEPGTGPEDEPTTTPEGLQWMT
jgi:hypothetical protein